MQSLKSSLSCPGRYSVQGFGRSPKIFNSQKTNNRAYMSQPEELITDTEAVTEFSGALPKKEIQVFPQFLGQFPNYDGTGVVIAIFDTGVDPGAKGLDITPDGRRKIIDVVDCTGSGDVDTSKVVTLDANLCIPSLTGNKSLKPNPEWKNPSGEWRVGAINAYYLLPSGLKSRLKEDRRRQFDVHQHTAVAAATAALAEFERSNKNLDLNTKNFQLVKQKEELESRVKILTELAERYEDQGPIIHCVVWNDGEKWVCALDTSDFYPYSSQEDETRKGQLADFGEPLTNFRDCGRYGTFSAQDACNYAINIYDEGNTLSIVVDAGSHGTHVAGIAAGYHPKNPSMNGIAPGAQIVSCKIGDTRLGSMETMVGLTRALVAVLDNKCDLINMSYGEATATPNRGRFIRLAEEIVYKHNVIFVASAGNAGPALSTVGAPGGTSSAIYGIGAFVSTDLAAAGHSLRDTLKSGGTQYTWSSRGPTPDGDIGVTFSAPGGAIAPVPTWTQQKSQLMNGTSMASPAAAGGIAVLLSALKAEGQPITPARIRRAIENTALNLSPEDDTGTLTYGRGLLQVADAFDYLKKGHGSFFDDVLRDLRLDISVRRSDSASTNSCRGIYMRDPSDSSHPTTWSINVQPGLKEDADIKSLKLEIDLPLKLKTTAPWIKAPELLLLHHNGRSFEVEIDPTNLPEGLHYAEIQGCDGSPDQAWRGPLFRVPITVIRPATVRSSQPGSAPQHPMLEINGERFVPGTEFRRFVAVPEGATWAELKIKAVKSETSKSLMVRATSIRPHTRYSDSEYRTFVQLPPHGDSTAAFAVAQGTTLELTIAQFWSSLGECTLDIDLTFHGIEVSTLSASNNGGGGSITLDGGAGCPAKVVVRAPLGREMIKPNAKLDVVKIPLRPSDAVLKPLRAPRDVLPGGRVIHSLLLTYKLSLTAEGGKITPRVPLFNKYVYDGEIEAQMYFVKDENNQLLSVGDIYPDTVTLKKGEYKILLHLRHEDPALLDRMRALPMIVERKLDSAITVPVFASHADAVRNKDAVTKDRALCGGESAAFFIGIVPEDKLPKDCTFGRSLGGAVSFGQTSSGKDAPGALGLTYMAAPAAASKQQNGEAAQNNNNNNRSLSTEAGFKEAVRDAQVKYLASIKTDVEENASAYESILHDLLSEYPTHLPLLREPLKRLSTKPAVERTAEILKSIVAAADAVLNAVDTTELAVYLAAKCPEEGEGAGQKKKEMEEKKAAVVEALSAKCQALLDLSGGDKSEDTKSEDKIVSNNNSTNKSNYDEEFEAAYAQLRRWVDPVAEPAHALLASRREEKAGRLALALKALDKAANPEDKPASKDVLERREHLMKALGWGHWARVESIKRTLAHPVWDISQ